MAPKDNPSGYGDYRGQRSGNTFAKYNGNHNKRRKKLKGHHRSSGGDKMLAGHHRSHNMGRVR